MKNDAFMIKILFSEVCNRKNTQRSTLLLHKNMYWKYLGKLTKSAYYIIKRKDSMLIIRRGGTFLPTPGHVRVKIRKRIYKIAMDSDYIIVHRKLTVSLPGAH